MSGNPVVIRGAMSRARSLALFEHAAQGFWNPSLLIGLQPQWADGAYRDYLQFRMRLGIHPIEYARSRLCGKNLGCWCGEGVGCHSEVWLAVGNDWPLPHFADAFLAGAAAA
jgi:hypothetical protein